MSVLTGPIRARYRDPTYWPLSLHVTVGDRLVSGFCGSKRQQRFRLFIDVRGVAMPDSGTSYGNDQRVKLTQNSK